MKAQFKKFSSGFLVCAMASLGGLSAHADDTEIFFGAPVDSSVRPNVMFIIDNSGSMKEYDGQSQTRMERVKSAMVSLLGELNGVNVGLMQFSMPGGPVLFPVTNIDAPLASAQTLSLSPATSSDDAEQASGGTVTLDRKTLAMTTRDSSGGATISTRVTASADDAEERLPTNTISFLESPSLEMPFDDFNSSLEQAVGLIFRGQAIPANARILSATVEFTIQQATGNSALNNPLNLAITGQTGATTVTAFSSSNVSSRPRTTASATWNINGATPAVGETMQTPNLAAVIQEIVSQGTWASGQDIALFFQRPVGDTSTGERVFSSFDQGSTQAPKLTITYEQPSASTTQTIGLRFGDVNIPQGSTITQASLEFDAAADNAGTVSYNLYGEKSNNADTFTTASNDLTGRPTTGATVNWTPAAWTYGSTYSTADQNVDLKSVIQDIVNQSGWCGGNALALFLSSGGGTRYARSFDDSPGNGPRLKVTYEPGSGGCVSNNLSYRVGSSSNDSRGSLSSGNDVLNDANLSLGTSGGSNVITGFRFTNIQIPKNATVLNAYIEFTAANNDTSASNLTIQVQNSGNAAGLCTGGGGGGSCTKLRSRTYLTTTVPWNNVPSFTANVRYRSDDVTNLVQPIVNRSDWNQGNAMMFAVTGTGTRQVVAFDGTNGATSAARLVVRVGIASATISGTSRDALISLVNGMKPLTATPIVDTLYEAARYYRGEAPQWGDRRYHSGFINYSNVDDIIKQLRISHPGSYTGGTEYYPTGCSETNLDSLSCKEQEIQGSPKYISPITSECQTNHIVFLTDGEPTQNGSESLVKSMMGSSTCDGTGYYACGPELSGFLASKDQSSSVTSTQTIKTHTIAFNLDDTSGFLNDIADLGDNGLDDNSASAHSASTTADLIAVFQNIAGEMIKGVNTTFVSPGVTVNTFNRLTHRNEIYYALFRPEAKPSWPGNLKRYGINSSGVILDKNAADAVDQSTGFFTDAAQSYWSSYVDGKDVQQGGAASNLPSYTSRNVFTWYGGSSSTVLSNPANAVSVSNIANITKARLGITAESDTYHQNLINWARGQDSIDSDNDGLTAENRKQLADPLHSVPHLVTYGGSDESPDITIFYGDNEGFLHAINASNGVEQFAFIPEALLPKLNIVFKNSAADSHPYGMDGPINSWSHDVDGNKQIEEADGDHVYVYAGMRRGGRNYYALNVTDRTAPEMLWMIEGGTGDFAELGQTWSKPVKTKVNISGTVREVLIFGGGYDPDQDNASVITADDVGRAIFIVDAATGAKIWSVGSTGSHDLTMSDMIYSIPSTVRVLDPNNDKIADQIYVGDVGGQVWRFDIDNGKSVSQLVTGGVIADISGTTAASARRFYHEPDASVIIENNRRKVAIAIGSGFQAHPLNEDTTDRFYVIKQTDVYSAPKDGNDSGTDPDYVKLTESNLYDATDNLIGEGSTSQQATALTALAAASGWYITLEHDGEKMLSTPLAVSGVLYFTTYSPAVNVVGCNASKGTSRKYAVKSLDATPARSNDDVEGLTKDDRAEVLKTIGLPADPVRLRISDDAGTQDILCVGVECERVGGNRTLIKTYWYSE